MRAACKLADLMTIFRPATNGVSALGSCVLCSLTQQLPATIDFRSRFGVKALGKEALHGLRLYFSSAIKWRKAGVHAYSKCAQLGEASYHNIAGHAMQAPGKFPRIAQGLIGSMQGPGSASRR